MERTHACARFLILTLCSSSPNASGSKQQLPQELRSDRGSRKRLPKPHPGADAPSGPVERTIIMY